VLLDALCCPTDRHTASHTVVHSIAVHHKHALPAKMQVTRLTCMHSMACKSPKGAVQ
jgi:hypothetical protein